MKKWSYLLSGVVIGAVVATSSSAFAAQVKSLVGKKVTGEYTVVVDGKTLNDKGAIIDSKANVPVRALSEALGAEVGVSGKTITISSQDENTSTAEGQSSTNSPANKYSGMSKQSLESIKSNLEDNIIKPNIDDQNRLTAEIERLKKADSDYRKQLESTRQSYITAIQQSEQSGDKESAERIKGQLKEVESILNNPTPFNDEQIKKVEGMLNQSKTDLLKYQADLDLVNQALASLK